MAVVLFSFPGESFHNPGERDMRGRICCPIRRELERLIQKQRIYVGESPSSGGDDESIELGEIEELAELAASPAAGTAPVR